jgi:hypothetical protein
MISKPLLSKPSIHFISAIIKRILTSWHIGFDRFND